MLYLYDIVSINCMLLSARQNEKFAILPKISLRCMINLGEEQKLHNILYVVLIMSLLSHKCEFIFASNKKNAYFNNNSFNH